MVNAYILIQTEVGKAAQVTEQIRVVQGVVAVDPVTGPLTTSWLARRPMTSISSRRAP